jgi:polysaccharide export outer membrane protein
MTFPSVRCAAASVLFVVSAAAVSGAGQAASPSQASGAKDQAPAAAALPAGYVIGAADILTIVFWRDKDMSAEAAVVRPDGKLSLPLLNDVQAAGLTPDELRTQLMEAARKYVQDPNVTVVVKEIHSRNVYITGNVTHAGTYPLGGGLNVLQLISLAGGLLEYADASKIIVMRMDGGRQQTFKFNYKDVVKQKHVEQNILLKPGDTVVVP